MDSLEASLQLLVGSRYQVRSSLGCGKWARLPWITITDATQSQPGGLFLQYLFQADNQGVYLVIAQGSTKLRQAVGMSAATAHIAATDAYVREALKSRLGASVAAFDMQGRIDLRAPKGHGAPLEKAAIVTRYYQARHVPHDNELSGQLRTLLDAYYSLVHDPHYVAFAATLAEKALAAQQAAAAHAAAAAAAHLVGAGAAAHLVGAAGAAAHLVAAQGAAIAQTGASQVAAGAVLPPAPVMPPVTVMPLGPVLPPGALPPAVYMMSAHGAMRPPMPYPPASVPHAGLMAAHMQQAAALPLLPPRSSTAPPALTLGCSSGAANAANANAANATATANAVAAAALGGQTAANTGAAFAPLTQAPEPHAPALAPLPAPTSAPLEPAPTTASPASTAAPPAASSSATAEGEAGDDDAALDAERRRALRQAFLQ